jgi:oxygen-independent coproporphyrinogen III oxidase
MADNTAFSLLKQRSIGSSRELLQDLHRSAMAHSDPNPARSLYIHIPFCSHKCHYCDFYSIVDRQDRQKAFTDRLVRELRAQAALISDSPLESIFVGGGTPSLLEPQLWEVLLKELNTHFDLSLIHEGIGEFTVECNPESVTQGLAHVLVQGGVNRASLGAQSFNKDHLKSLERLHNPDNVPIAVDCLHQAGIERLSVDLIYAVPGQSLEDLDHDLQTALSLPIEHISAYGLTYEPGTAMTARLAKGEFQQAPDDIEAEMYQHTINTLRSHGFERYEVSNHAKQGARCKHNMAYWTQRNWLAIGPSASGHFHGARWKNTPRLDDYLNFDDKGFSPVCEIEEPDTRRELMDLLMTSIRLSDGVDAISALETAETLNAAEKLNIVAQDCHKAGWIIDAQIQAKNTRWQLNDEGFLFADRVAREFIGALIED